MIKRYIAIAAVSAVSAAAMYFLNKANKEKEKSTEAKEKTELRNPVSVVTKEDFLQAGISVDPPEGASNRLLSTVSITLSARTSTTSGSSAVTNWRISPECTTRGRKN